MKNLKSGMSKLAAVSMFILLALPAGATAHGDLGRGMPVAAPEEAPKVGGEDAIELGSRSLGEKCTKDCQCASLECKGFKCVKRDLEEHPILPKGSACAFDGDCASCDCAGGSCR